MKYKDAIKQAMEMLVKDERAVFLGYNVNYGSRAYGTLSNIPKSKCLETPVAENLMAGLAIGMALEGYKPIVFFERHDFMLNALDGIVNHLDKMEKLSKGQFKVSVIIRAIVGSKEPLDPGLQHTQDFTEALKKMVSFPIVELKNSKQIMEEYKKVLELDHSVIFVERKELYEEDV